MNKKAFSVVEYVTVFIIIIGAFLVMRNYIQRSIFGMSANAGQNFAFGRQYDSQKSIECSFDEVTGNWYDANCFKSQGCAIGNAACEQNCPGSMCNQVSN